MVTAMPAWLVAILVAVVGFGGVFARIAYDRGADLRTRMLDAADDFVTAVTRAHDAIESAALPTGLWVEFAWMDTPDHIRAERQDKAEAARAAASAAWETSRQRVPRISLLFGVNSPTAEAATRTDEALGEALVGLARAYAESHDPENEPMDGHLVTQRATEHLEAATAELRDFSASAHAAIKGWRPAWRRRLDHARREATSSGTNSLGTGGG